MEKRRKTKREEAPSTKRMISSSSSLARMMKSLKTRISTIRKTNCKERSKLGVYSPTSTAACGVSSISQAHAAVASGPRRSERTGFGQMAVRSSTRSWMFLR